MCLLGIIDPIIIEVKQPEVAGSLRDTLSIPDRFANPNGLVERGLGIFPLLFAGEQVPAPVQLIRERPLVWFPAVDGDGIAVVPLSRVQVAQSLLDHPQVAK